MLAYVNDMAKPALVVPELEGTLTTGGISLGGGQVKLANLVLKPDAVENLSPAAGYRLSGNDSRYLRHWEVTEPREFPYGQEVVHNYPYMGGSPVVSQLPDSTQRWSPISAGEREIVNLSRVFGRVPDNGRRLVWLRTSIGSDRQRERILNLGFSDEVWVFVNGQALYADKNHFASPGQKFPKGRCTIENSEVRIPLRQGKNEILIGLANYFYGWGLVARLDDTDGLRLLHGAK